MNFRKCLITAHLSGIDRSRDLLDCRFCVGKCFFLWNHLILISGIDCFMFYIFGMSVLLGFVYHYFVCAINMSRVFQGGKETPSPPFFCGRGKFELSRWHEQACIDFTRAMYFLFFEIVT